MLDATLPYDKSADIAHGFDITTIDAQPDHKFDAPGRQRWWVTATLSAPMVVQYESFHPTAGVDGSDLHALRAHVPAPEDITPSSVGRIVDAHRPLSRPCLRCAFTR